MKQTTYDSLPLVGDARLEFDEQIARGAQKLRLSITQASDVLVPVTGSRDSPQYDEAGWRTVELPFSEGLVLCRSSHS